MVMRDFERLATGGEECLAAEDGLGREGCAD